MDEAQCRSATRVAAAWCGASSGNGQDDSGDGDGNADDGSGGNDNGSGSGAVDCTTCTGCIFASNGQCYTDIDTQAACLVWEGNQWCGG